MHVRRSIAIFFLQIVVVVIICANTASAETLTIQNFQGTGGTVAVPVMLKDANAVGNIDMSLDYGRCNSLSYVDWRRGSLTRNSMMSVQAIGYDRWLDIGPTVNIAVIDTNGFNGDGSLIYLNFAINSTAVQGCDITFVTARGLSVRGNHLDKSPVTFSLQNGQFRAEGLTGDCNHDGQITSVDALMALQMATGTIPVDMIADMNNDGAITSFDAIEILRLASQNPEQLPNQTPATAPDCNDFNPCTDDSRSPAGECVHTYNTKPCDDGDLCTTGDVCSMGQCRGSPVNCEDNITSTKDYCDPARGECVHIPVSATITTAVAGMACDDGNPQTINDVYDSLGRCVGIAQGNDNRNLSTWTATPTTPVAGTACNDGNACTAYDIYDSLGGCTGISVNCDDNNPYTTDSCDSLTGCRHIQTAVAVTTTVTATTTPTTPVSGTSCNDNDPCTTNDALASSGVCKGVPYSCNDNNICTRDVCDGTGGCQHIALPHNACNDNNACTSGDICGNDGSCRGFAITCNDNNPNTVDSCNAFGGCVYQSIPCTAGKTPCNGVCVDLNSDKNNCGRCGAVCSAGYECSAGTCRSQYTVVTQS